MTRKRRTNRTGRNEAGDHYAALHRRVVESPAWRALSLKAQALYPWLLFEWRGPKFNRNGNIRLSVRQAAERLNVSKDTAALAFRELQAKGFIVVTSPACLGTRGHGKSPDYELTDLPMPGAEPYVGRRLYHEWRDGEDFDVVHHSANNPKGLNGENNIPSRKPGRSRLKNHDENAEPVTKTMTPCPENRDVRNASDSSNVIDFETSLVTTRREQTGPPALDVMAGLELCPLLAEGGGYVG